MRKHLISAALLLCSQAWALDPFNCRPKEFENTGKGTMVAKVINEVSHCAIWTCPAGGDQVTPQLAFVRNDLIQPGMATEWSKAGIVGYGLFGNLLKLYGTGIDACSTEGRALWQSCANAAPVSYVKALCPGG